MLMIRTLVIYIALMTAVVVASNVLVQYPLPGTLFGIALGDISPMARSPIPLPFSSPI